MIPGETVMRICDLFRLKQVVLKSLLWCGIVLISACQVQPMVATDGELVQDNSEWLSKQAYSYMADDRSIGDPQQGEQLFNQLCTSCHGYSQEVDPGKLFLIGQNNQPPHLDQMGDVELQRAMSPAYLQATIQHGKSNPAKAHSMPAWREVLVQTEINNLVAFIVQVQAEKITPRLP